MADKVLALLAQLVVDPEPDEEYERTDGHDDPATTAINTVRGCAILGPRGVLAATGDLEAWAAPAAEMLAAADAAAGGNSSHAHVATEEGEAYVVRQAGLAMVAVTDRFTLASLVLADMRATLRELARQADESIAEAA